MDFFQHAYIFLAGLGYGCILFALFTQDLA